MVIFHTYLSLLEGIYVYVYSSLLFLLVPTIAGTAQDIAFADAPDDQVPPCATAAAFADATVWGVRIWWKQTFKTLGQQN